MDLCESKKKRPFDRVNDLQDEADVAESLLQVHEDRDPALLAATLGDIARARTPSSDTLFKVMRALG